MKTTNTLQTILVSMAIALCSHTTSVAGNVKESAVDSTVCLKVTGKIVTSMVTNSYNKNTVTLYEYNIAVQTVEIADNKTFRFFLKKNRRYAIKISKDGFISNLFCFNTILPEDEDVFGMCSFFFNTELIAENESIHYNTDALDFPAALVSYIPKKQVFDVSIKYSRQIENEILSNPQSLVSNESSHNKSRKQNTGTN